MNIDEQYSKGFNDGYLLRMHEPILMTKLLKTLELDNVYLEGLVLGTKQYEAEQLAELKKLRSRDYGNEREK